MFLSIQRLPIPLSVVWIPPFFLDVVYPSIAKDQNISPNQSGLRNAQPPDKRSPWLTLFSVLKSIYHSQTLSHTCVLQPALPLYNSRTFLSPQKETLYPLAVTPIPHPQPLATANLLSVSMDWPILDFSYQWDCTNVWPFILNSLLILIQ